MKTLIIHPKDSTTDFLSIAYENIDCTLINTSISKSKLKTLIKEHDKIIMMGHGTEKGLANAKLDFIIDSSLVYLLREKLCIGIWCNADEFFKKYDLKGFYSGMIISEYEESLYYAIYNLEKNSIEDSNTLFASSLKLALESDIDNSLKIMKESYLGDKNPIIEFNKENLYYNHWLPYDKETADKITKKGKEILEGLIEATKNII